MIRNLFLSKINKKNKTTYSEKTKIKQKDQLKTLYQEILSTIYTHYLEQKS